MRPALLSVAFLAACQAADPQGTSGREGALRPTGSDGSGLGHQGFDEDRAAEVLGGHWVDGFLISDDAVILDDLATFAGVDALSAGAVTLRFNGPASVAGLRPGSVLVSGRQAGLLRRVEALSLDGELVHIATTDAALSDVILQGLDWRRIAVPLDASDLQGGSREATSWDFTGTVLYEAGAGPNHVKIDVESGTATVDPTIDLGLDIDWADWTRPWPKVEKAETSVTVETTLHVVLRGDAAGAVDREGLVDLYTVKKPFELRLGPVPVGGQLDLDVDLLWEYSASAEGTASVGADAAASLSLGGRYLDGDWENTSAFDYDATRIGPSFHVEGDVAARATLRVTAMLDLYDRGTADARGEPWVAGEAALRCGDIEWALSTGVELDANLSYDVFGMTGSKDFPTWSWSKDPWVTGHFPMWDAAVEADCGTDGPEPAVVDESAAEATGGSTVPDASEEERFTAMVAETCSGGLDDDGDGASDCDDSECADDLGCGSQCEVWDQISCGTAAFADTRGFPAPMQSQVQGWGVHPGNYSGPEAAFEFTAPHTGVVRFALVDPSPQVCDHDLVVLASPNGRCATEDAVAWGPNEVEVEVVAGATYILVIDGFDGDAGEFGLEVRCD